MGIDWKNALGPSGLIRAKFVPAALASLGLLWDFDNRLRGGAGTNSTLDTVPRFRLARRLTAAAARLNFWITQLRP